MGLTAGDDLDARVAHHFTVRDGHIVRFEQFVDSATVREAMAPSGPST